MAEAVTLEMIFELLRRALDELREVRATQREHSQRLGRIDSTLARMWTEHGSAAERDAEQQVSLDRLRERVERIEQRLELRDMP